MPKKKTYFHLSRHVSKTSRNAEEKCVIFRQGLTIRNGEFFFGRCLHLRKYDIRQSFRYSIVRKKIEGGEWDLISIKTTKKLSYRTHWNISAFPPLATMPDCTPSATNGFKNVQYQCLFLQMMRTKKERTLCDMAVHRVDYNSNSWRRHREKVDCVSSIGRCRRWRR